MNQRDREQFHKILKMLEDERFIESVCLVKSKPPAEREAFLQGAKTMAAAVAMAFRGINGR